MELLRGIVVFLLLIVLFKGVYNMYSFRRKMKHYDAVNAKLWQLIACKECIHTEYCTLKKDVLRSGRINSCTAFTRPEEMVV